jgi:AcrR family transcriptional regulator
MNEHADLRLRNQLIDRIRSWVDQHGLSALTLEEAAKAAGTTLDELREFFDSRDELVVALVAQNRVRLRETIAKIERDESLTSLKERRRAIWRYYLDNVSDQRLFFEAYALALGADQYNEFLGGISDWLAFLKSTSEVQGVAPERVEAYATLTVAVFRGAMMDYCATGERARINAAMELWFHAAELLEGER